MQAVTKHPTLPDILIVLDIDRVRKLIRDLSKVKDAETETLRLELEKVANYKAP